MLTPRRALRALMPGDYRLMKLIGADRAAYMAFLDAVQESTRIELAKPYPKAFFAAVFGLGPILTALINLSIGILLSFAASLLLPRPNANGGPGVNNTQVDGQDLKRGDRFTAKSGFDSVQNVVELGSIVPLIYARREVVDGVVYGGVRVNTDLLWSQIISFGGNQMFRGVFLVGQGGIQAIDLEQTAIGDNLLTAYGLTLSEATSSRLSMYLRLNGGRIADSDFVLGRQADQDPGNFERRGGADVFTIPNESNQYVAWASTAGRPSNQTTFGVYAPIPMTMSFRFNPQMRPAYRVFTTPRNDGNDYQVNCALDLQALVQRFKYKNAYHSRISVFQTDGTPYGDLDVIPIAVGDQFRIFLSSTSDGQQEWLLIQPLPDGPPDQAESTAESLDVAQAISGRQRSADDAIIVGERYLIGSVLAVCISRSENSFTSDADFDPYGGGTPVTADFRAITAGHISNTVEYNAPTDNESIVSDFHVATERAQAFRVAIASVTLGRKARVVEVGIRSTLGIQINSLCNFSTCLAETKIDNKACKLYEGKVYDISFPLPNENFISGQLALSEERYSFWKIAYRKAGSGDPFTVLSRRYGVKGIGGQPIYNYIRMAFPSEDDWEFQFQPISGWEARNQYDLYTDEMELLDFRAPERTIVDGGLTLTFNGRQIIDRPNEFRIGLFENLDEDLGIPKKGPSYVDPFAKLAEIFIYDEITTSADNPEHEISYVNIFTSNPTPPEYDDLAILGLNIQAGREMSQLGQLSVYVTSGLGGVHTFPEVLYDMLTNANYSASGTLSPAQINLASFNAAEAFTRSRRYFCDIAVSEPINRRSWAQELAPNFLLDFTVRDGQWHLDPLFSFDTPEPITAMFTADNVVEDSFELSTVDLADREPVRVSVRWREERQSNQLSDGGLFPLIKEVTVKRQGTPDNAKLVRIDMSDYCTSLVHAIDVGKLNCLAPELQRTTVRFRTWPQAGTVVPGRCFKMALQGIGYSADINGSDPDGNLLFPMADGTYNVLLWSSANATVPPAEQPIVVTGNTIPTGNAVFAIKRASSPQSVTFKASSVRLNEESEVEVEGIEFPLDENGISLYAQDFDNPAAWVIEGAD